MIEAFLAGILASMTPCILVLFPITLYRFMGEKRIDYAGYLLYLAGFMTFFVIFGAFFKGVLSSALRNGVLLFIAVSLVVLGILQLMNRINPLSLYPVKNTFLFGAIFSFGVATSPCSLPFLGTLAGFSIDKILPSLVFFGLGILVAPTVMLFIGTGMVKTIRKAGNFMEHLNRFLSIVLIGAGIYLGFTVSSFSRMDVISSTTMVFLLSVLLIWLFSVNKRMTEMFKFPKIFLLLSLILLFSSIAFHCYGIAAGSEGYCAGSCFVCQRCLYLFLGSLSFAIIGSILVERYELRNHGRRK